MKGQNKNAFTLVELVIVAVILAILATVGFISYEDYLVDTRDSKRLSQLAGLRDSMRLQITRGKLPLPDNSVEIRNNATPFLYQGYAGKEVLETISYSEKTMDPFDDVYYTYLVSRNRKDFQIMGFLEKYNKDVISFKTEKAFASVDYSQRYPNVFGKKLGILLEQESNTPLHEIPEYTSSGYIDLRDSTSNLFDAYVTDTYKISGKETELIGIIPYTTCKKILETGGSYGNGIYNVNPSGLNPFEAYCLMDVGSISSTIQGGWTLIGRSVDGGSGKFGWLQKSGSVRDDSLPYSFGPEVQDIGFKQLLFTSYSSGKNINSAILVDIDYNFFKSNIGTPTLDGTQTNTINSCTMIFNNAGLNDPCLPENTGNRPSFKLWGKFAYDDRFLMAWRTDKVEGLNVNMYTGGYHMSNLDGKQGMIFIK